MKQHKGFSLIELLIVISLVALATVMGSQAWQKLYLRSNFDFQIQSIISDLSRCSEQSQTQQRQLFLSQCQLTKFDNLALQFNTEPVFQADGTNNGAVVVVKSNQKQATLTINQLTSAVQIHHE